MIHEPAFSEGSPRRHWVGTLVAVGVHEPWGVGNSRNGFVSRPRATLRTLLIEFSMEKCTYAARRAEHA